MVKLLNIGNTCYLNSILQFFFNSNFDEPLNKTQSGLAFYKITNAVQNTKDSSMFNPKPLLEYLNWNSKFDFGRPHDAHEAFMYLVDKVGDSKFKGETIDFMHTISSPFEQYFKKQIFVSLEIAVTSNSFSKCIENHFLTEKIDDWKDSKQRTRSLLKITKINSLPEKLIFVLRQPIHTKFKVQLPYLIDLNKFCVSKSKSNKYVIKGFIVHKSSHYYTLIFKNNKWIKYDDDIITFVSHEHISNEYPYIIMFESM